MSGSGQTPGLQESPRRRARSPWSYGLAVGVGGDINETITSMNVKVQWMGC